MKLFVGLGNPGAKYARNRHNVGFMAVDRIANRHGFGPWRRRFQGETTEGTLAGERVLLLKPGTYMNESGRAVGEAARFLKIPQSDVVVFYDEIDLAPGKVKVKTGGGNAGHNGLRSLSAHIGNDYVRVRIGVGHPGHKDLVVPYVLHDFAKADRDWLEPLLDAVADACGHLAVGDQARFLTDVAKALQKGKSPVEPAKTDAPAERSAPAPGRPTAEPTAKRSTALAESLRRWITGRKSEN
jgi:peptidyl-tRNA hydrolase, PTH1 family